MNDQSPLAFAVHSIAEVATPNASRYLQQLCKHFAHRRPVDFSEKVGQIHFASGRCRLAALANVLRLSLAAENDEQMAQLQDVVAHHLVRFAFREEIEIDWHAAPDHKGGLK